MSVFEKIIHDANARLIEGGNVAEVEAFFSENYVANIGDAKKSGYATVRGFTKAIHKAFSDIRVDVEVFLESGNKISWQRTIRGKQTGAFQGFPASGLLVSWRDMVVSEIDDSKIVEEWVVTDLAEALLRSRKGK